MNLRGTVISKPDFKELLNLERKLLHPDGYMNLLSAEVYHSLDQNLLRYFCWKHGIYQIPTKELIEFLRGFIRQDKALEVAAGMGNIGRWLNITMTDSKLHNKPEVKSYYESFNQPICKYSQEVIELDGNKAVDIYKPDIVIGSWVTEKDVNTYGIDEKDLLDKVGLYVCIGNEGIHDQKFVLKSHIHQKLKFNWLISRSSEPEKNCIYVIRGKK